MKNKIPLLLLTWLVCTAGLTYLYQSNACCSNTAPYSTENTQPSKTESTVTYNEVSNAPQTGMYLSDGNKFAEHCDAQLKFSKSQYTCGLLTSEQDQLLEKTTTYLQKNKDRSILITGGYKNSEENNSLFPNLGLARANYIKTQLIKKGCPAQSIAIDYSSKSDSSQYIDFAFKQAIEINQDFKDKVVARKIILHFNSNDSSLALHNENRNYLADLIMYCGLHPKASIQVDGYTDNRGAYQYNYQLGLSRAESVKNLLYQQGITSAVNVNSYGPDSPIENNDSPQGRAKNRRVELFLQQEYLSRCSK